MAEKKNTLLQMLVDKEPLEAIQRSFESMLLQSDLADIDILDNSCNPEVHAYFRGQIGRVQGYHCTQAHLNYAAAFGRVVRSGGKANYNQFIIVQPGDELPGGHVAQCEEIMDANPHAEVLLFHDHPNLAKYHGKLVEESHDPIYEVVMCDHYATITQACVRCTAPFGKWLFGTTVEGIAWVMLTGLCQLELVVWNKNDLVQNLPLPTNPIFHLMGRYEKLISLSLPEQKKHFVGVLSAYATASVRGLKEYAASLSEKLNVVGRMDEAVQCILFSKISQEK